VNVCIAGEEDVTHLARLLWLHAAPDEQARQSVESFAVDLAAWWTEHDDSHLAFVARLAESEVVGMAWLAFVPRVPRPGTITRRSADIQSVFVLPEQRGKRIGSALVQAASEHALRLGADHVTVHSGRKAVPVYERLGFASSRELLLRTVE
jgi:GNAT superfamily N-acetyltransferase